MPRRPADYAPLDLAYCRYVLLYRVGILTLIEYVFAGFGNCGSALRRLSQPASAVSRDRPPLVLHSKSLPKRRSYVQLSPAGCRRFGVSPAIAAPLGKAALDQATAIAYACAFSAEECHRTTRKELLPFLGTDTPPDNVAHVLAAHDRKDATPTLYRVYHAVTDIQTSLHHVTRLIEETSRKRVPGEWLRSRDYGFAILCPTRSAVSAMTRAIEKSGLLDASPMLVELGPTADTLDEALRGEKR